MNASDALVGARGVTVRYGATDALSGVDLELLPGEVHAVVGENGAGKSTLLAAIAGVVQPAAGAIRIRRGVEIAWVTQDADLPADLTATE